MIPLILFDDVSTHNELLETLLGQVIREEGLDAGVALTTTNADELISYANEHSDGGIYFLDIELQREYTGVDVCRKLRDIDPAAHFVYVSAYPHYAMECLKSHAFDFLLKPFTREELSECLLAAIRDMEVNPGGQAFNIPLGSRTVMIDQSEILYITTRRNFLVAHTTQGELTWRGTLAGVMPQLERAAFKQISRFCAVNWRHVREANWADDKITMDDSTELKVSRRIKKGLQRQLSEEAMA